MKKTWRTFQTGRNHQNDSVWEKFSFLSYIQKLLKQTVMRKDKKDTTPNVYIPVDLHRFKLFQEFPMNYLILKSPFRLERLSLSISCGINSSLSRLASNGERQIEFFDPCEETEAVV